MAALADDQGVVEGVTTEQLCAAAGAADRTYRRARATLLASGEVVLRSGSGGRGTRTAGRSRTRAPIAAPRGWHVAGGRAPAGGDDLDRELLRVECEQVAVSGDERVGTAGCCECDKVVVVRVAADGWRCAGEEDAIEGLLAGANDCIVKPFSARELIARVAAQLELSRQLAQSRAP